MCIVLALSACDGLPSGDPAPAEHDIGVEPVPGLRVVPKQLGDRLLDPADRSDPTAVLSKSKGNAPKGASPYGCLMSTPAPTGPKRYWHHAVYLHFPNALERQAERTVRLRFQLNSTTIYSDTPRDTAVVARVAHCRIPDVPAAHARLKRYLKQFRSPAGLDWGGGTWEGEPATASPGSPARADALLPKHMQAKAEMACANWYWESVCWHDGCIWKDPECTEWVYLSDPGSNDSPSEEGFSSGGSGSLGGGGSAGDSSDPCTSSTLTSTPEAYETCTGKEIPWAKAIKIGRKMLDAAERGEDLLDASTWKKIAKDEWDELIGCGLDALDATSGDPVALLSGWTALPALQPGSASWTCCRG